MRTHGDRFKKELEYSILSRSEIMDEDVLQDEYIGCHPCVNTSSLKMRTEDVINTFLPAVGHDYKTVHLVGED